MTVVKVEYEEDDVVDPKDPIYLRISKKRDGWSLVTQCADGSMELIGTYRSPDQAVHKLVRYISEFGAITKVDKGSTY